MSETIKVQLSERKIKMVVKELNKVLDDNNIYGQEWNKQVIEALILDNLTRNKTIELLKELEQKPISEWND